MDAFQAKQTIYSVGSTVKATGVTFKPADNTQLVGTTVNGRPMYSDPQIAQSNNLQEGSTYSNSLIGLYGGFGALDHTTANHINKAGAIGSDYNFLSTLDNHVRNQSPQDFTKSLKSMFGDDPKTAQSTALSSAFLYSNWDNLSNAQKSIAVANTGIQAHPDLHGTAVVDKQVPNSTGKAPSGMTVGQGLKLVNDGVNGYGVSKHWDQISPIAEIAVGKHNVEQGTQFGVNLGMVGRGLTNSIIDPSITDNLSKIGATPSPAHGVGAITVSGNIPPGYKGVGQKPDGTIIAVPSGMEPTASVGPNTPAATHKNIDAINNGTSALLKHWDRSAQVDTTAKPVTSRSTPAPVPTPNPILSAVTPTAPAGTGGSAVVSGLIKLGTDNAHLLSGALAHSAFTTSTSGTVASQFPTVVPVATDAATGGTVLSDGTVAAMSPTGLGAAGGGEAALAGQGITGGVGAGGIAAGAYTGYQQIKGAQAVAQGKKLSTQQQAALALPTFGASLVYNHTNLSGGKGKDQSSRDSVRSTLKDSGLFGKDYKTKLADGTIADFGVDGHGDMHTFKNADKIVGKDGRGENGLHAYDIDYTNDLDFFSGMAGMTLATMKTGTDATSVKQVGGQLGNQALGKVGYGKDMTPENFGVVMQNMRGMYAQAGIKSKEEAIALSNKMFADKRINDTQLVQMQQSISMVYDGDVNLANKLSSGRFKGIDVSAKDNPAKTTDTKTGTAATTPTAGAIGSKIKDNSNIKISDQTLTKEQIIAKNKDKFREVATTQDSTGVAG